MGKKRGLTSYSEQEMADMGFENLGKFRKHKFRLLINGWHFEALVYNYIIKTHMKIAKMKPRNRMIPVIMTKKAGAHGKTRKAQRRAQNMKDKKGDFDWQEPVSVV